MDSKRKVKKNNKEIGNIGEVIAKDYLLSQGYEILNRNYRCPKGEIDIIAKEQDVIIFVEVKTRTNTKYGQPFEAVDRRKLQRLYTISQFYIYENKLNQYKYRFDIVSINLNQSGNTHASISLIKNVID